MVWECETSRACERVWAWDCESVSVLECEYVRVLECASLRMGECENVWKVSVRVRWCESVRVWERVKGWECEIVRVLECEYVRGLECASLRMGECESVWMVSVWNVRIFCVFLCGKILWFLQIYFLQVGVNTLIFLTFGHHTLFLSYLWASENGRVWECVKGECVKCENFLCIFVWKYSGVPTNVFPASGS